MSFNKKFITILARNALKTFTVSDHQDIALIPQKGPLIIAINHINFLEVPLIALNLLPRKIIGMAKKETWDNPIMRFLFNTWEAIPLDRENMDMSAFRKAMDVLKHDGILCVAPEGTRSKNGSLLKGQPGIVQLAYHTNSPILPLVHFGGEKVWDNLKRIRKTRIKFKTGQPFRLKSESKRLSPEIRNMMIQEIMYQLAILLPEEYRGAYSDVNNVSANHLDFIKI